MGLVKCLERVTLFFQPLEAFGQRCMQTLSMLFSESWNVMMEPLRAYRFTFRTTSSAVSLLE